MQKLQTRQSIFQKVSLADKDRSKWEKSKVLTALFMSSEESATDDGEEILLVKDLPWRSDEVNRFFQNLDDKEVKSAQARCQSKKRIRGRSGMASQRPKPVIPDCPTWLFAE